MSRTEVDSARHWVLKEVAEAASHELREPTRSVSLLLQIIERHIGTKLSESELQLLHEAITTSDRMYAATEDLLRFLSTALMEPKPRLLNLEEIWKRVVDFRAEDLRALHVSVAATFEASPLADQKLLEESLSQLLDNALKSHPKDSLKIWVGSALVRGGVQVRFRDNGGGGERVASEAVLHLYKRTSSWNDREGTGLGLALSGLIARLHGGEISVDLATNGGCEVILFFPIANSDQTKTSVIR